MSTGKKFTGQCLCGGFRYEYQGDIKILVNCHCGMCRKATGASFYTLARVLKSRLTILEQSTDTKYQSSANVTRHFCSRCGCSLYDEGAAIPESLMMSAATLDQDPGLDVNLELFVDHKAPWTRLYEGVPRCPEFGLIAAIKKLDGN